MTDATVRLATEHLGPKANETDILLLSATLRRYGEIVRDADCNFIAKGAEGWVNSDGRIGASNALRRQDLP